MNIKETATAALRPGEWTMWLYFPSIGKVMFEHYARELEEEIRKSREMASIEGYVDVRIRYTLWSTIRTLFMFDCPVSSALDDLAAL